MLNILEKLEFFAVPVLKHNNDDFATLRKKDQKKRTINDIGWPTSSNTN